MKRILGKQVIVFIRSENNSWIKSDTIWFWKSKKKYLRDTILEFNRNDPEDNLFINIKLF